MTLESNILKWAKQINSSVPLLGESISHTACRKLSELKTLHAIPFLVSALAHADEQIRGIAEDGLKSLNAPETVDGLFLGYIFTQEESLRQILTTLGRPLPKVSKLLPCQLSKSATDLSPAEEAWQFQNTKDETILSFIPEGNFIAGKDSFSVHLPPYYLAITCVTNAQYAHFLNQRQPNSSKLTGWINLRQDTAISKQGSVYEAKPEEANLPAVWVTWEGATAYCKWAGLRLPTELEWEKGARGIDGRLYPWGDEWEAGRPLATPGQQKQEQVTDVLAYPMARSPYGLYQMIGNVYEWCADSYDPDAYQRYSKGDLKPPQQGEHRVLRGGPWRFGTPAHLRTEYRKGTVWRAGTPLCGFRCAKSP